MSFTRVQKATPVNASGVTNKTITLTGVTVGNLLVFVACSNKAGSPSSVTEGSDTVFAAKTWGGNGASIYSAIYYAIAGATTATVSVTIPVSGELTLFLYEYTGNAAAGLVFDQSTAWANAVSGTTATSATLTPGVPGELAFGVIFIAPSKTLATIGGGYAQVDTLVGGNYDVTTVDQVLSGSSAVTASGTWVGSGGWMIGQALFVPGSITQPDSAAATIAAAITASSPCASGDLIVSQFQLNNVTAGNAAFTPTISDTVNSGNYTVQWTTYYAAASKIYGWAYIAANATGTPVVSVTPNAAFSGGQFNYIRLSGFSATPTLDSSSTTATGAANPITGSMTTAGVNEAVLQLMWNTSGGSGVTPTPGGWSAIFNASGAGILGPFWLENFTSGTASFSGNSGTSAPWYSSTVGFSSGPAGKSIAGAFAAFTMTGIDATLVYAQPNTGSAILLANPGAFDLLGAQAQTQALLSAGVGLFSMTGIAANFTNSTNQAFSLACATGFFTMTGIDAVLQGPNYIMSEFTGFFTWTGFPAILTISGASFVPPGFEVMPNLVGLDWLGASAVLWYGGFAELQPQIVKGTSLQEYDGIVTGQTPTAFTVVPNGCAVQLSVASSRLLGVSFESH